MAHLDKPDAPQQAPSKQDLVEELAQLCVVKTIGTTEGVD
jgi:hypothetical protein